MNDCHRDRERSNHVGDRRETSAREIPAAQAAAQGVLLPAPPPDAHPPRESKVMGRLIALPDGTRAVLHCVTLCVRVH